MDCRSAAAAEKGYEGGLGAGLWARRTTREPVGVTNAKIRKWSWSLIK